MPRRYVSLALQCLVASIFVLGCRVSSPRSIACSRSTAAVTGVTVNEKKVLVSAEGKDEGRHGTSPRTPHSMLPNFTLSLGLHYCHTLRLCCLLHVALSLSL